MKSLLNLIFFSVILSNANAQTSAEWFRQKATQKKYLLQQIAGLQIYIGYAQKGYSIAKNGLGLIGDIKQGDFNLHNDYFNSLKTVNPSIRQCSKIADIIALQVKIVTSLKNNCRQFRQSSAFTSGELTYINEVFNRLADNCANTIDQLIMVITGETVEMKDNERLHRIDALYNDMQDKYSFVQSFVSAAKILAVSRVREENDIKTSRIINGIK